MPTPIITYPMRPKSGADFCASNMQTDARFLAEPKINGIRFMANLETKEVWNRHGQPMTDAEKFGEALAELAAILLPQGVTWVDCESWGRYEGQTRMLFVIDAIFPASDSLASLPYSDRRKVLENLIPVWDGRTFPKVVLMPSGESTRMWNWMLELRQLPGNEKLVEGIVLKRVDSLYETQRVSPTRECSKWTKFRFDQSIQQPVKEAAAPIPSPTFTRKEIIEKLKPALVSTMVAATTPKPAPAMTNAEIDNTYARIDAAKGATVAEPTRAQRFMKSVAWLGKLPTVGDVVWFVEGESITGAPIEAIAIQTDRFGGGVIEIRTLGAWRDFSSTYPTPMEAAENA